MICDDIIQQRDVIRGLYQSPKRQVMRHCATVNTALQSLLRRYPYKRQAWEAESGGMHRK